MTSKIDHELFMRRALELATLGLGKVSPNPMVGCVIVYDNQIIGEGWHKKIGEAHAEVNAINNVKDKSKLKESTVYVSLEPCAHFGKTPPCADLLVKSKVSRVVVATKDPNPKVAGKGLQKLIDAGIDVIVGVLEEDAKALNKRFFCSFLNQRPYIILKWAQTSDGFVARKDYSSKWISNDFSRQLVHKWRSEEDAILVGKNTAKYDNPSLNVRSWKGSNPARIVIDHKLSLKNNLNLFDQSIPTICYNYYESKDDQITYVALSKDRFEFDMLADLHKRGISSLIIEGGAQTLHNFLQLKLWDEARVFVSEQRFEEGIEAPKMGNFTQAEIINNDRLLIYKNQ